MRHDRTIDEIISGVGAGWNGEGSAQGKRAEWFTPRKISELPKTGTEIIVDRLWRKAEVLLFGGHSKSWKSWSLMDLLFCIANGFCWLVWEKIVRGRVLHIDLELFDFEIRKRYEMIFESYGKGSLENIDVLSLRGKNFTLGDFSGLGDLIEPDKYSAVLFDPTYRLLAGNGLSESDPGVITDLMNRSLEISSKINSGIGLLQHFSKGGQTDKRALDAFSGSGVWGRAPDICLTFRELEDEKCYNVSADLRHWPSIDPFAVRFEDSRFRVDATKDPENLKVRRSGRPKVYSVEELCRLIDDEEYISNGCLLRRSGVKKPTFDRYLRLAKEQNLIALNPADATYFLTAHYIEKYRT